MHNRNFKLVAACLCLVLLIVLPALSQEQQNSREFRLIDSYGDVNCEDTLARLDLLGIELRNNPSAKAYIIGYSGRSSPFSRILHRLKHARRYLIYTRGIDDTRIITIDGGHRENLTVEAWLVPIGVSPPEPTPAFRIESDETQARRFDYGYLDFIRENGRYRFYCCDICPLEIPDIEAYASLMRENPHSRAHVIIYFGYGPYWYNSHSGLDRRTGGFRIMARLLRNILVRDYGMNANRISVTYGGGREVTEMELWIVPSGAASPQPTPTHFGRRIRRR